VTKFRVPAAALCALALAACAASAPALDERGLVAELGRRPGVLLGEVHDNPEQHRARAGALRALVEQGARPAIAFEQFDRNRQADIDEARKAPAANSEAQAAHVIERGRTPKDGWDWPRYQPFVVLALQYDLPIVAANLSRADAARVAREGIDAVFDPGTRARLDLDRIVPALQPRFEAIVRDAHCGALPESAVAGLARAQIARDAVLADALRPYLTRGVVLLTGNGHARRDLGVPRHLDASERGRVWSIGLLEAGGGDSPAHYDAAFVTPPHERADPCESLRARPPR